MQDLKITEFINTYDLLIFIHIYYLYKNSDSDEVRLKQFKILDDNYWIWDYIYSNEFSEIYGYDLKKVICGSNEYSLDEFLQALKSEVHNSSEEFPHDVEGKDIIYACFDINSDKTNRFIESAELILHINKKKTEGYFNIISTDYISKFKSNNLGACLDNARNSVLFNHCL